MKTKRFRLLSVLLAAVMFVAMSLNVYAAGNAVTKDGLTAQLITDKGLFNGNVNHDRCRLCRVSQKT